MIGEDVDGEALATLAVNKLRGTINVVAVKAPGFGDRRNENLGDMAALTGATVISKDIGRELDSAEPQDLGAARRVVITKDETTIIEGKGTKKAIEDRISSIRAALEQATSDWDREKLEERLGKLSGSVAVVKVGAATEVELNEKKHRVEDALSATRAAVEEGIVPGGGVAFLNALSALDRLKLEGDEATGPPHPAACAGGAAAPHRSERRRGRLRDRARGAGIEEGRGLRRGGGALRRHDSDSASSTRRR